MTCGMNMSQAEECLFMHSPKMYAAACSRHVPSYSFEGALMCSDSSVRQHGTGSVCGEGGIGEVRTTVLLGKQCVASSLSILFAM